MKPSWHVQSLMEVDATGDDECSGQRKQAVPMSEPNSGLYVPSVQSTIRPAVLPQRESSGTGDEKRAGVRWQSALAALPRR